MSDTGTHWTIHQVAERTGISVHTLRAWERRYGIPKPGRMESNRYRLYDEQDIADVLWMKEQVAAGISPAQAGLLLRQQRQAQPLRFDTSAPPLATAQGALERALLQSDEASARHILEQSSALFAPEQVALQIIEPSMRRVGESWQRGEITIWQEHLASNIVRERLLAMLQAQPAAPPSAPLLVAACAPREEHELGLLIFALCMRRQGWRVAYIGQETPLEELDKLARQLKPNLLAISVTTVVGLSGLIPYLVAENRPATPLLFGGVLPNHLPRLAEHLPGLVPREDVLTVARNLLTLKPPARFYQPSRRAWNAVQTLHAERLKVAAQTIVEFATGLAAGAQRNWSPARLNVPTLHLVDTLTCALAFDVPELMDAQGTWLQNALPLRGVAGPLVRRHVQALDHVLDKTLGQSSAGLYGPLLERFTDMLTNERAS